MNDTPTTMKAYDSRVTQVLMLSGGRTSGYMLRRVLDDPSYDPKPPCIFCNTGKEMPQTLDFVRDMEEKWGIVVTWLEYCRVPAPQIPKGVFPTKRRNDNLERAVQNGEKYHWFKEVTHRTASRNGTPFNDLLEWSSVLPNPTGRICSVQLKMRTAFRYLCSLGVSQYEPLIGIRKDEDHRAIQIQSSADIFETPRFPLVEWNVCVDEVNSFWKNNDFDLQLDSMYGNCDLCFLKAKWKRLKLIRENPTMAEWWKGWENKKSKTAKNGGGVFRLGQSYSDLQDIALGPQQIDLFSNNDHDIACSCAEKGFSSEED
jgi:3'-phosphoadenosine 5'-phosphosulfate sulfotransferase (PAPS reductase)/FAD synthetase